MLNNNVKLSVTWQVKVLASLLAGLFIALPGLFILNHSDFKAPRADMVPTYSHRLAKAQPSFAALPSPETEAVNLDEQGIIESAPAKSTFQPQLLNDEVMWLARVIYSETKRPYEQELVAWVVRNRVETRYRGKGTYRTVVLDPWQFSAFNRNAPKRRHYTSLNASSSAAGWRTAMEIAYEVYHATPRERPFSLTTRHFYSEQSMRGRRQPAWAAGKRPVQLNRNIDPRRFRFFENIA